MKKKSNLTQARLKELLTYHPKTGLFRRNQSFGRRFSAGTLAGKPSDERGYLMISLDGVRYYAHRLAWLYMTGSWPKRHVDHIKGMSNRFSNLRDATNAQNLANRGKNSNNTSGVKGVIWSKEKKKWRANVMHKRKSFSAGYYSTLTAAASARLKLARRLHGEFAR